jgi:CBS domain-containing protein
MKVQTILAKKGTNVVTIHPEQTLREAARLLAERNIGALVVVNEAARPVGILSERDIIRAAARHDDAFSWPVSDIMTRELITGVPQDDVRSVMHTMTEKRFRHLPILEHGELVGIVSIGDVVKAQRDEYQGELDTLQIQVIAGQTSRQSGA